MTDTERPEGTAASDLEGGGTDQTWGQGEGPHEPTIPDERAPTDAAPDQAEESPPPPSAEPTGAGNSPTSYAGSTPAGLDDPDLPLSREDEGMDR